MEPSPYTRLNTGKKEIRVLRPIWTSSQGPPLLKNATVDPTVSITAVPDLSLEFELRPVSLNDAPVFTALSYYWGGKEAAARPKKPIIVNGHTFWIQYTLEVALRNLQYEDIAPAIWIDWLCINQQDKVEKSVQIEMMREIYSFAAHVVVWLGEATKHSDFLAGAIRGFGNEYRRLFDVPTVKKWPLIDYFDPKKLGDPEAFQAFFARCLQDSIVENPEESPYSVEGFVQTFLVFATCRPWWYRVWIIQEFVLAQKVFFQSGTKKFHLEDFSTLLATTIMSRGILERLGTSPVAAKPLSANSPFQSQEVEWTMRLFVAREQAEKQRQLTTYQVLCQTYCHAFKGPASRRIGSTVEIDYVYGLVGLCQRDFNKSLGLKVKSWETCEVIYTEVAEKIIASGQLDLLALCQRTDPLAATGLPSWAPDWREAIQRPNMWFMTSDDNTENPLGNSLFSAATHERRDISFIWKSAAPGANDRIRGMRIRGAVVDGILESKPAYLGSSAQRQEDINYLYGNLFRDIQNLCRHSRTLGHRVYSRSVLREAPWRIPIRDHEVDMNADGYSRATRLSRARYYQYLPMFKVVEADLALLKLRAQKSDTAVSTWEKMRIEYQRALIISGMARFQVSQFLQLKARQLWAWVKLAAKKVLRRSRRPADDVPVARDQNVEFNMYVGSMQAPPFRPFITRRGYIGLGPQALEPGDVVCLLFGARVPHILRPRCPGREDAGYALVGEAFVYGIMDGEFVKGNPESQLFEVY